MELKVISLSVGDFALPSPRRGSIDPLSGFGSASQLGIEIHQRLQQQRRRRSANYQAEVLTSHKWSRGPYQFSVSGRMDGVYAATPTLIEEIKSTYSHLELKRRLEDDPYHPYCLQLRTYGYLHWLKTDEVPCLLFHLVSTRNWQNDTLVLDLGLEDYERWLDRRLNELTEQVEAAERRGQRRQKVAKALSFPFVDPRPGQMELVELIEQGFAQRQPMLLQAPTGLGKTVGILYPTLKEALGRGQRVLYVTPKNSQHRVAEEALERFRSGGVKLKNLTITAKSKLCLKNEPLCNPQYCEYARDHYSKVAQHGLAEQLRRKRALSARTFRKMANEYQVCPFELQWEAVKEADTVICDYNYVFSPKTAAGRVVANDLAQEGKPCLVIDEVHNLPARAMDYYSPGLSSQVLRNFRERLHHLPLSLSGEAKALVQTGLDILEGCRPEGGDGLISPKLNRFYEHDAALRTFLSRYVESDCAIEARDPILGLCFYWSEFSSALEYVERAENSEFFMTFQSLPEGGLVKVTCCDASAMLKDCYENFAQVIGFSATVKPFAYYSQLAGLQHATLRTAEFASPFPREKRKLLIIPQISSKFSQRERNFPKIAETLAKVVELKLGNYFVFFPSFQFLQRVWECFQPPSGFQVRRQERVMKTPQIDELLQQLSEPGSATIVFAVQGGVLSEGIDYPGKMVIGAFIVGPPLPTFDLEREQMRRYYEAHYGAGFDYAYTFPAMAKAVQAAGRVIRSPTDEGLIVLMDDRFLQASYSQSMPRDWFEDSPNELVSTAILNEVRSFWSGLENSSDRSAE